MCGIAGYYRSSGCHNNTGDLIKDMTRLIRHRGPDDEGYVLMNTTSNEVSNCSGNESDRNIQKRLQTIETISSFPHNLAFGHRRYSIIDLSDKGHQPFWDNKGLVCAAFNGEIYNYVELRRELKQSGHAFYTNSDTEVLVKAYIQWGEECFKMFNGPWALCLYDTKTRRLLLSRDRIGKSPLYYTVKNGVMYWASEIKSILNACGTNSFAINNQAVDDYLISDLRDFDGTFWADINDFPPACYAWIQPDLSFKPVRYWTLPVYRESALQINKEDATEEFRRLLIEAIRIRLRADVPVGFELSGGMDSSSLVALCVAELDMDVSTFTAKFREANSDESPFAMALVDNYPDKITPHILEPHNDDFWKEADEFVWIEEEPFHAPNLQTNQNLRKLIRRQGYKVVISGGAGDEVLAGYPGEYFLLFLKYLYEQGKYRTFFHEIKNSSEYSLGKLCYISLRRLAPKFIKHMATYNRISDIGYVSQCKSIIHRVMPNNFNEKMAGNITKWKMNYWMRSGNKSNYGIPIEARSPFLDYKVVDFAFKLPPEYLIQNGWHKWILRNAVKDILPEKILWRKHKMGFPFPFREWLIASRPVVKKNLKDIDCPYINYDKFMNNYEMLTDRLPIHLWRLISIGLWWRRVIQKRHILN